MTGSKPHLELAATVRRGFDGRLGKRQVEASEALKELVEQLESAQHDLGAHRLMVKDERRWRAEAEKERDSWEKGICDCCDAPPACETCEGDGYVDIVDDMGGVVGPAPCPNCSSADPFEADGFTDASSPAKERP